jgi:hypothetical protein
MEKKTTSQRLVSRFFLFSGLEWLHNSLLFQGKNSFEGSKNRGYKKGFA